MNRDGKTAQKAGMTPPSAYPGIGVGLGLPGPTVRPPIALSASLQNAVAKAQEKVAEESASLEDNYQISASQRYSIMQKLAKREERVRLAWCFPKGLVFALLIAAVKKLIWIPRFR